MTTQHEYRRQRTRLRRLVKRWQEPLGLGWWSMRYRFERDPADFARVTSQGLDTDAAASTLVNWRYMHATIAFNLTAFVDLADDEAEGVVVHEMCHVLLDEMHGELPARVLDTIDGHEERVCTLLARAFISTREDGMEEGKRAK